MFNVFYKILERAGDGADCRDFTIKSGIVQPLIALIKPELEVCTLCNGNRKRPITSNTVTDCKPS